LPYVSLINNEGIAILTANNLPSVCLAPDAWYDRHAPKGLFRVLCRIPGNLLREGHYFVNIGIGNLAGIIDSSDHVYRDHVVSFEVVDKASIYKEHSNTLIGIIQPRMDWKTEYQGENNLKSQSIK